ncbi:leucine--tRNA ligase [bacterium (Candidatus Blackallbacteria) CG17_big_fil_post_rev_8_21_14_2_50_48_46]|uniref:Leucine--tRNA ligase n=1 Tax=bacterium (Candidatus Blackallbacteria) CG17_big_fil_post_rev_8_21_14_2_50_48_46 TaxID=2014261 RepID=A0A2M7G658_9BACT|nr:MAG: leucine--tRNA ligase [bacterium (Candidatus Blackallbacteria) CG18_big_fil_WC_8_21_14_2_50_49_26]PIW17510.1 MAG: leucine--tRNA ligase [bacterium (Candidatus Blackallbacteria) CG17_big_fil_post_rev_8_21_14_2_50_48_46]PIW48364.1 MAG: leucine--tRNA ligase [bacterium (Candidatus Blackallbacteria) CG13_big_fil_rev_8_21_14_2_50_49_14]
MSYNHQEIDAKWQQYWAENKTFKTESLGDKPKYYVLDMFPYPSGQGLHVGHPKGYVGSDIIARYKRMRGFDVLHPMGWDAFGLPTERQANKESLHPAEVTRRNTDTFRKQLQKIGLGYDWDREINTSQVDYYRWTQWIFLKLYEKGLAYQAELPVNWCPALGTVLANEEVKDGVYVETGDPVEKRMMQQWMLKITAYADQLLDDLDTLDWPESLKEMQRHWIGKAEGARVRFQVADQDSAFDIFTTRPDTLFGCTYCVLAPEHPLVPQLTSPAQKAAVEAYIEETSKHTERERMTESKKTGVFTGAYAINPVNHQQVPIWIADYVLASYGTGAVFACPAHDERDWEFANTFDLPLIEVVQGGDVHETAYTGDGPHVDSEFLDGLNIADAKKAIIAWLEAHGHGEGQINYRLRDWLFSRQRYWGEPIPVVHLEDGTVMGLSSQDLPIELPHLDDINPTEDGQPPLARAGAQWREVTLPDGRKGLRETNTMPQWAGSCWYYLRFIDPQNNDAPWDPTLEKRWMPVDLYVGGTEHATLHLLYARFWHKVLYDLGLVSTKEPFQRLFNQGKIQARSYRDSRGKYYYPSEVECRSYTTAKGETQEQWFVKGSDTLLETRVEKMSKSKHNVVTPDETIEVYGADSLRLYEVFMGPLEDNAIWQTENMAGVRRFLERVWRLYFPEKEVPAESEFPEELERLLHKTIQKVGEDLDAIHPNTAVSTMMIFVNEATRIGYLPESMKPIFARILAPFAPHLAEEFWASLGHSESIAKAEWPVYDPEKLIERNIEIPVQLNGKLRGVINVPVGADEASVRAIAEADEAIQKHLEGVQVVKVIHRVDRMLNLVVK